MVIFLFFFFASQKYYDASIFKKKRVSAWSGKLREELSVGEHVWKWSGWGSLELGLPGGGGDLPVPLPWAVGRRDLAVKTAILEKG